MAAVLKSYCRSWHRLRLCTDLGTAEVDLLVVSGLIAETTKVPRGFGVNWLENLVTRRCTGSV
jgi:predicted RecB family nuclease